MSPKHHVVYVTHQKRWNDMESLKLKNIIGDLDIETILKFTFFNRLIIKEQTLKTELCCPLCYLRDILQFYSSSGKLFDLYCFWNVFNCLLGIVIYLRWSKVYNSNTQTEFKALLQWFCYLRILHLLRIILSLGCKVFISGSPRMQ